MVMTSDFVNLRACHVIVDVDLVVLVVSRAFVSVACHVTWCGFMLLLFGLLFVCFFSVRVRVCACMRVCMCMCMYCCVIVRPTH